MRILGIRVSPSTIRYAILDWDGETAQFKNRSDENKMDFPANASLRGEKLHWLYRELNRLINTHTGIDIVGIKEGEFTRSDTLTKRERVSLEGLVLFWAYQKNLPAETKIFSGIKGVKRKEALEFCENKFGKSETYWNDDMADALLAAWSLRELRFEFK